MYQLKHFLFLLVWNLYFLHYILIKCYVYVKLRLIRYFLIIFFQVEIMKYDIVQALLLTCRWKTIMQVTENKIFGIDNE